MIIIEQVPPQGNGDLQVENLQPKGTVSNKFWMCIKVKKSCGVGGILAFKTFKSGSNTLKRNIKNL